jgi:hypothetical protein
MTTKNEVRKASWLSIDEAAAILGVRVITLRRAVERNARRNPDGGVTSATDGVRARKFGRRWRVALDPQWLEPLTKMGPSPSA